MSNEALKILQSMARTFYKNLNLNEQEASKPIDIIVTDDGLRIFLYNRKTPAIFEANTANLTSWGQFVIETLSWLLDRQPMKIRIDSITSNQEGTKSWEISLERSACVLSTLQAYNLRNASFELLTGSAQAVGNSASDVFENCERIEISLKLG